VTRAAPGDVWGDVALPEQAAVLVMVVAAVGVEPNGAPQWTPDPASNRWDAVNERDDFGDVVAVATGQRHV
jgi:hypothetical protein